MTNSNKENSENIDNLRKYNFDTLKMYFGYPHEINIDDNVIQIRQPDVSTIVDDEKTFYQMLYVFIGNTTMFRLQLWDMGQDWNKISDYELFCSLIKTVDKDICYKMFKIKNPEYSGENRIFKEKYSFFDSKVFKPLTKNKYIKKILLKYFGEDISEYINIDFDTFDLYEKTDEDGNKEQVLYSEYHDLVLSQDIYNEIREYLRSMFNMHPKDEFARNKATKLAIIDDDRMKIKIAAMNGENVNSSTFLPLVSFATNHPGYKYNLQETLKLGICHFMDCVQRLQYYEGTRALYGGMYSGFCDLSKQLNADPDLLNFAKDLSYKEANLNNKDTNGDDK